MTRPACLCLVSVQRVSVSCVCATTTCNFSPGSRCRPKVRQDTSSQTCLLVHSHHNSSHFPQSLGKMCTRRLKHNFSKNLKTVLVLLFFKSRNQNSCQTITLPIIVAGSMPPGDLCSQMCLTCFSLLFTLTHCLDHST